MWASIFLAVEEVYKILYEPFQLPSPHISQPYNNVGFTILSNRSS